jgi:hypothetical protein
MKPAIVIYSDNLPPDIGGQAHGPVVVIREKYKDDEGLLRHELTHVWQWWLTLGFHPLLYLFVRPYRLWAEVAAYRRQMKHPDRNGNRMTAAQAAACLMLPRYEFDLTADEALAAILGDRTP